MAGMVSVAQATRNERIATSSYASGAAVALAAMGIASHSNKAALGTGAAGALLYAGGRLAASRSPGTARIVSNVGLGIAGTTALVYGGRYLWKKLQERKARSAAANAPQPSSDETKAGVTMTVTQMAADEPKHPAESAQQLPSPSASTDATGSASMVSLRQPSAPSASASEDNRTRVGQYKPCPDPNAPMKAKLGLIPWPAMQQESPDAPSETNSHEMSPHNTDPARDNREAAETPLEALLGIRLYPRKADQSELNAEPGPASPRESHGAQGSDPEQHPLTTLERLLGMRLRA